MLLNLRHLEVFHAIIKTGSITGAARLLNVTQPAISASLKQLEQNIQFTLFERSGGRLTLTPEGEALLPDVKEIFGRVETFIRMAEEMRDGAAGRLIVASSPTLVECLLPQAVSRFRTRQSGVALNLESVSTDTVIEKVFSRVVDMGVIYGPADDIGIDVESVGETDMICAVRSDHWLAAQDHVHADDLVSETVITLGAGTRLGRAVEAHCIDAGIPPPTANIDPGAAPAGCTMALMGTGVALVDSLVRFLPGARDLKLLPFRPTTKIPIQLIFPRDRLRSRACQQFADCVRSVANVFSTV